MTELETVLNQAVVLMDENQPAYVQRGVQDLREYLEESTGNRIPCGQSPVPGRLPIRVGPQRVAQAAPEIWRDTVASLGPEGSLLQLLRRDQTTELLVAGVTPQGTKSGLVELLKRIRVTGKTATVSLSTPVCHRPSFAVRGIHLNGWAFNYPYSFRAWHEEDWRRYIDLLTYQGVNLLFLWPFMEIMPVPLSAEDESYLQEVRRVVDYAQRERGLEVWVLQSPNRVAVSDAGVRDPRLRPYWVMQAQGDFPAPAQADMNPADPAQFARIMQSRAALYQIVNNADAYCTLDSDPGGWPGSPLGDFTKIFQASRALLDRHCVRGTAVKQINWLWTGWGMAGWWARPATPQQDEEFGRSTIRAMQADVPEPWGLVAGRPEYLPACAAEGALSRTVYLPYNTIEGEPSRPGTQFNLPAIRAAFDEVGRWPGIAGVMGNVQTPLLQLPHVSYFLSAAWDVESRNREPVDLLRELAEQVYPDQAQLLTDGWLALDPANPAPLGTVLRRIESQFATPGPGRLGVLGRKLFPAPAQLAADLVLQLRSRAALAGLAEPATAGLSKVECARRWEAWLDAALAWDQQHGWSDYWLKLGRAWDLLPTHDGAWPAALANLGKVLGGAVDEQTVADFLAPVADSLMRRYPPRLVTECATAPLAKAIRDTAQPQPRDPGGA